MSQHFHLWSTLGWLRFLVEAWRELKRSKHGTTQNNASAISHLCGIASSKRSKVSLFHTTSWSPLFWVALGTEPADGLVQWQDNVLARVRRHADCLWCWHGATRGCCCARCVPNQLHAPLGSPPTGGVVLWLKGMKQGRTQTAGFESQLYRALAVWPWASYLTSFCHNFSNYKMGLMMLPTLIGLPWGLSELHVQHFKQCCAWNQYF